MTEEQQALVRSSFAKVAPNADAVAAVFYARLFELDPSLRSLFKGDMQAQGRKLMAMIATAVAHVDRLDVIVPAVAALGQRHQQYGVKEVDYDTVGSALLGTLQQGLGDGFDRQTEEAWTVAYATLAGVMKQAAGDVAAG
jgi:hemoglobin-like flavoprotein